MKKIKLVMFDFDGTLVDTAADIVSATNLLLIKHHHLPLAVESIKKEIGTGLKTLLKDFFPEASENESVEKDLMEEFLDIYKSEFLKSPSVYPGASHFLKVQAQELGLHIAIVSNKKEELIHPILQKLELHQLPWVKIIGGDTFDTMKPDPQPLKAAISAAGVSPLESVLVGDGTPDIQGAVATGCRSVAVSFGYTPIDILMNLGASTKMDDYKELTALLGQI